MGRLPALDADSARRARAALDRAGYTLGGLNERLGPHAFGHLSAGERAPLLRATRGGDRLDVLLRLFVVGEPVPAQAAAAALAPLPLGAWRAGGLLEADGDDVAATIVLRPLGYPDDHVVVHDRPDDAGNVRPDHVLGVSASTLGLSGMTIRRPIDRALDLGTGCGIQAVYAAAHSESVIATDLSERAVACATLTMQLDDLTAVDVRRGDLFEPVEGERFDLIVANPPFVISPSRRYLFRDSELPVDEISRSVVAAAARHLAPGGHAQLLASWAQTRGEDWRDHLAAWVDGCGVDTLVLQRETFDPAEHAASWLRQTERPDAWDEYDEWLDYYAEHGIEAIGFGLISMRKRDGGAAWFRAEDAAQDVTMPCGDHVGATFELVELSRRLDDVALLELTVAMAPGVVLDEQLAPADGGWRVDVRRLRQTTGLCRVGEVDERVAAIVAACDGRRSLGEIVAAVAAQLDVPSDVVKAAAVPLARQLLEDAIVLPASVTGRGVRPSSPT